MIWRETISTLLPLKQRLCQPGRIQPTAQKAVSSLATACETWRTVLTGTTDADLDQVGRSQLPWGLDPKLPFIEIVWWVNQELLSHGAEIALLRDLYRALQH